MMTRLLENTDVVFQYGPMWQESLVHALKDTPNIGEKLKEFISVKSKNPLANFGTNDHPFKSDGIYKRYLPKAKKAHLSMDMSLIYEISGRNPTTIKVYGIFTHADLGTGQPPNIKRQKNMAKRLSNEELYRYLNNIFLG